MLEKLKLKDLKKLYLSFEGRLNRIDFLVFSFVPVTILSYIFPMLIRVSDFEITILDNKIMILSMLHYSLCIWFYVITLSKRLHDVNKSAKKFITSLVLIAISAFFIINVDGVTEEEIALGNVLLFIASALVFSFSSISVCYYIFFGLFWPGDILDNEYGSPQKIITIFEKENHGSTH